MDKRALLAFVIGDLIILGFVVWFLVIKPKTETSPPVSAPQMTEPADTTIPEKVL